MFKQWGCVKCGWIPPTPAVLTLAVDRVAYFTFVVGFGDWPIEMMLRDILDISVRRTFLFEYVSIKTLGQELRVMIHHDSAKNVAQLIQAAVDEVKSNLAQQDIAVT